EGRLRATDQRAAVVLPLARLGQVGRWEDPRRLAGPVESRDAVPVGVDWQAGAGPEEVDGGRVQVGEDAADPQVAGRLDVDLLALLHGGVEGAGRLGPDPDADVDHAPLTRGHPDRLDHVEPRVGTGLSAENVEDGPGHRIRG